MASFPVVLDPALLAFTDTLSRQEFEARVRFLAQWAGLVRSGDVQICLAPEIRAFLLRKGYFPAYATVAACIDSLGLRFRFAPEDVIGPINTLLTRASGSTYCCVTDEQHDEFHSYPTQPWCLDASMNEQVQRAVILSSIERDIHAREEFVFVSRLATARLEFSARIYIMDPDTLAGFAASDLPKVIQGKAVVANTIDDVLDSLSAEDLWSQAHDNSELKVAIQIRCREKLKINNGYHSMDDVPQFFVGPEFYTSLARCQACGSGKFAGVALDACASAVLGLPTFEWNAFDKPNRKADGAAPLRAHLTKSGPALRLMAWQCPTFEGSRLEFANVGEKWEEEIAYTEPADAV